MSCLRRISDELAVADLAGESGRLDPGLEEGYGGVAVAVLGRVGGMVGGEEVVSGRRL